MKISEAKKLAKKTGKPQMVTELEPITDVKVQISLRLDLDVLSAIKNEGERLAIPYQTLINSILKQHISLREQFENRLAALEAEVKDLKTEAG